MIFFLLAMNMFISPSDPLLNKETSYVCPCTIRSEEIQKTIETLYEVAFGETKDPNRRIMVGLAAPQIGIDKSILLIDTAATGVFTKDSSPSHPRMKEFINPEILWQSDEKPSWREGCYSTGRICGIVPRSQKVLIRAYDRKGNIFTEEYEGYVARILQHEIDHLKGIRFPDRIAQDSDLHWVEEIEIPQYRIDWPNWPNKALRSDWVRIRDGLSQ